MKRVFTVLLGLVLVLPLLLVTTTAEEYTPEFKFELSVDGQETKEVHTGDIITVTLRLRRTDSKTPFTMYAMQNEIRYDSNFFEIVNDSAVLGDGIASTDIAMTDEFREFYLNYLSMSGGAQWDADTMVGTFQLKVKADAGVTTISNQDYLVSYRDGSGSYPCEANELTIILSTDCLVRFMTGGGSEIPDQTVQFGEPIIRPEDPIRDGYIFAGWYKDIHLTEKWDFETDTVQGNMTLYAKWAAADVSEPEDSTIKDGGCWLWWLLIILILLVLVALYIVKKARNKRTNKE